MSERDRSTCHEEVRWEPVVDRNRCEAKEDCVAVCPYDVFEIRVLSPEDKAPLGRLSRLRAFFHGNRQAFAVRADACHGCGLCVKACPEKAIKLRALPQALVLAVVVYFANMTSAASAPPDAGPLPEAPASAPPSSIYTDLMMKALPLIAQGRREEAATLLLEGHRLNPTSHMPHQRLCALLPGLGRTAEALIHCKLWRAREPHPPYQNQADGRIRQLEGELEAELSP